MVIQFLLMLGILAGVGLIITLLEPRTIIIREMINETLIYDPPLWVYSELAYFFILILPYLFIDLAFAIIFCFCIYFYYGFKEEYHKKRDKIE